MKNLSQIFKYIFGYKKQAALNIVFNFLFVILNLASMLLFMPFMNLLFDTIEIPAESPPPGLNKEYLEAEFLRFMGEYVEGQDKMQMLAFICGLILVLFFLKNLFRFLAMVAISYLRRGVARDLRRDVYDKILALPLSYFGDEQKGDILARSTADVNEIELSLMGSLEGLIRDPINVLFTLITMLIISVKLTLFSFILLPITGLIISRVGKSLKRSSAQGQDKQGELLSYLEETLGGMRIIKAFNAEDQVGGAFAKLNDEVRRILVKVNIKLELSSPLSEFLGACVMVGVVWFGGSMILGEGEDAPLTGSQFIGFIILFYNMLRPIQSMSKMFVNINRGSASVDRMNKILHADNRIHEALHPLPLRGFEREVRFNRVGFAYTEDPVLTDIDFELKKGRSIALVGESGGGKSTIADLLPRFYDVREGSITIDGVDIREAGLTDVRALMGIVTQQSILFNNTIFDNIAFGMPNATEEEVVAAAKVANAHDFIMAMPKGYQTNIGDGGNKLSGGQKQRLSIARAVLKNPPILILDEATSALDTESEKLVQDALMKLMKDRTSLVIAHRLSTIQHVDEILVLVKGRIVERGRHDDLVGAGGVYQRLCELQGFS